MIDAIYEGNKLVICQAGGGKTVCGQTAAQELIADDVLNRVIIFAPLKVCNDTWAHEYKKWEHLWDVRLAVGDEDFRRDAIEGDDPIVILNLDNLAWFMNNYHDTMPFDGIMIDEISKLKSAGGSTFKALRGGRGERIKRFTWRCGMSATPVHDSGTDIYTQMLFVDGGEALGTNQENFRREYFMQEDFKGYKWKFQPGGEERLAERLKHSVFVADTEDYEKSLPPLQDTIVPVEMPEDAWYAYDGMANALLAEIGDLEVEAPNLAAKQGKLQQIACGAVYNPESREPVWIHRAKFEQLGKLLADMTEPVIIVYQFIYELEYLKELYPLARVLGSDPDAQQDWNDGKISILLLHPKSAGHGVNIQFGGSRVVWLSPVWSADQWDQTTRRVRRRGQPAEVVHRYILKVAGTVEDIILGRHDKKLGTAQSFIDHLRERQV